MTLTLLDLYNSAATQEWSMYDNDANSTEEFEKFRSVRLWRCMGKYICL